MRKLFNKKYKKHEAKDLYELKKVTTQNIRGKTSMRATSLTNRTDYDNFNRTLLKEESRGVEKKKYHSIHRSLHRAAIDENEDLFEWLLMTAHENTEKYANNLNHQQNLLKIVLNGQDSSGRTALHYIAMKGNSAMCEVLYRYSKICGSSESLIDLTIKDLLGATAIHYATKNVELYQKDEFYDEQKLDLNFQQIFAELHQEEDCLTKLLRFSKATNQITLIQELRDNKKMTPLHWACQYNNVKAVISLLIDFQLSTVGDFTTFEQCRNYIKTSHANSLVIHDDFGRTPLHISIAYNANLTALFLLTLDLDIFITNNFGETILHLAAAGGNLQIVNKLLSYEEGKKLLLLLDNIKQTPLHQALTRNRLETAKILLDEGGFRLAAAKDVHGNNSLHKAATIDKIDLLKLFEKFQLGINEQNQKEQTALHIAAKINNIDALKYMLETYKDADVNLKDETKSTPLLLAAEFGSKECFEYLFKLPETDRLSTNGLGMTCLHLASKFGCTAIVKLILKDEIYKDLLNFQDFQGNTPMHHAAEKNRNEIIKALLETNACNVTLKNEDERAIVHLSARTGRPAEFSLLLQKDSAQALIRDFKDNTPLIDAAKCRNTANVSVLLKHKAEVDAINHRRYTALGYCSMRDTVNTAKILIKEGASLEAIFPDQLSPLQIACFHGSVGMVKFLLQQGVSVSYRSIKTNGTALEIAIDKGHDGCVREILKSKKWKTAMRSFNYDARKKELMTPIRKLFNVMPENALLVMDQCIHSESKSEEGNEDDNKDESNDLLLDLEFCDDAYSCATWESLTEMGEISLSTEFVPCYDDEGRLQKYAEPYSSDSTILFENHPLNAMIESGNERLLDHPLTKALVKYKWRAFGGSIYYFIVIMNFLYVFLLTAYMISQPLPYSIDIDLERNCYTTINFTYSHPSRYCSCCRKNTTANQVLMVAIILLASISIMKESFQFKRAKWQYFLEIDNCVEIVSFVLSIISVFNFTDINKNIGVREEWQWEIGATAVLSAWLMLAMLVRKLPIFGIYVIMVGDMIRSFAKAFLIFTIFLLGFGMFFYMMIGTQVDFHIWYLSVMRTLVMMLGELDYKDIFFPDANDPETRVYESTVFVMGYVFFCFLMPIIIMNLLVGLAVDDIKSVMEEANKQKLVKMIQLALDVEFMMPSSWRRHFLKGYYKVEKENTKSIYKIKEYFLPDLNDMHRHLVNYKDERKEEMLKQSKPNAVEEKVLLKLADLADQTKQMKSNLSKIDDKLKKNEILLKKLTEN